MHKTSDENNCVSVVSAGGKYTMVLRPGTAFEIEDGIVYVFNRNEECFIAFNEWSQVFFSKIPDDYDEQIEEQKKEK